MRFKNIGGNSNKATFIKALIVSLCQIAVIPQLDAACRTVSSAVRTSTSEISTAHLKEEEVSDVWDEVLSQRWKRISDCIHPEWPARLVLGDHPTHTISSDVLAASNAKNVYPSNTLLVHAGDKVVLWRRDAIARIETTGVSEESGELGKHIHVRVLSDDMSGTKSFRQVAGVIRGSLNVEMGQ